MRRSINVLILLCFIASMNISARAAGDIAPFQPRLTLNLRSDLCPAFLEEWTRIFASAEPLWEEHFQAAGAYPYSLRTAFPASAPMGLYGSSYSLPVDFDGDGDLEVLHIDSRELGWRYLGVDIFLVESEEAYSKLRSEPDKQQYGKLDLNFSRQEELGPSVRLLYSLRPLGKLQIFTIGKELFTISMNPNPSEDRPQQASLVKLNAPERPTPVCAVDLLPAKSEFAAFRESSQLFQNLADVYGGPQGCQGTMGWTAPPVDAILPILFHRPQTLLPDTDKPNDYQRKQWSKDDPVREVRFMSWAAKDPQSWKDYTELKRGRSAFIQYMQSYYREHFAHHDRVAAYMAETAWRAWLDTVVYARNPDGYNLTKVALRNNAALPLSPTTPPEEVARIAVEAWLEANENQPERFSMSRYNVWTEALVAATLARLPMEIIMTVADRRDEAIQAQIAKVPPDQEKTLAQLQQLREAQMDVPLAAALGDIRLMEFFLAKGANPDASTTWFHKTPLMYAAQQNELSSAKLLIERGADVNAETDGTSARCHTLDRDHRTALMYAAENADADLIELLLDSGADISATDTKNNLALWYFEKNTLIKNDSARQSLRQKLTP